MPSENWKLQEWEPLIEPCQWRLDDSAPLTELFPDCTFNGVSVSRNELGALLVSATGAAGQGGAAALGNPPAQRLGEIASLIPSLQASDGHWKRIELLDSIVVNKSGHLSLSGDATTPLTVNLHTSRLKISYDYPEFVDIGQPFHSIWCYNLPTSLYCGGTSREYRSTYKRTRNGMRERNAQTLSNGGSQDSVPVPHPLDPNSFALLCQTRKEVSSIGRPGVVEFEASRTEPLDWGFVDRYLDSISFALGREILGIGVSVMDDRFTSIHHDLRALYHPQLSATLARPTMPPTPLNGFWNNSGMIMGEAASNEINEVARRFSTAYEQYNLGEPLSLIWLSDVARADVSLVNLATALESLANSWFKANRSPSKGTYLPTADWQQITPKPIALLEDLLGEHRFKDRIVRRMQGVNNFGANERIERFLEEIELEVGEVERSAIRSRNKMVHGGAVSEAKVLNIIVAVRAYRSLINRVILKLIGHEAEYVDYSTFGFPSRHINEPLGGPEGDRQSLRT